jgi:enoyl-CoA hydratase/carnithine racemase
MGPALSALRADRDLKVVVLSGTGADFCTSIDGASFAGATQWHETWWEGKRMLTELLAIDVPVIGVVNGPATIHAEIPLLADIVIASENAEFADHTHFTVGAVPGDGAHLIWPYLIGRRRAKYFLLTGQKIDAATALQWGVVDEILPHGEVETRAGELAAQLATKPQSLLRYTREALNMYERAELLAGLSHGLALEGASFADDRARRAAQRQQREAASQGTN